MPHRPSALPSSIPIDLPVAAPLATDTQPPNAGRFLLWVGSGLLAFGLHAGALWLLAAAPPTLPEPSHSRPAMLVELAPAVEGGGDGAGTSEGTLPEADEQLPLDPRSVEPPPAAPTATPFAEAAPPAAEDTPSAETSAVEASPAPDRAPSPGENAWDPPMPAAPASPMPPDPLSTTSRKPTPPDPPRSTPTMVRPTPPRPARPTRSDSAPTATSTRQVPARSGARRDGSRLPAAAPGESGPAAGSGTAGGGGTSAASRAAWQSAIIAHVRRNLRPQTGLAGSASVQFAVDRSGRILAAALVTGTGQNAMDAEAIAVFRRSQPFPSPPPDVPGRAFSFTIPLRFTTR